MEKKIKTCLLILLDIFLVNFSLLCAYLLRFDGSFHKIFPEYVQSIPYLAMVATIVKITCYFFFRLYKSLWKYAGAYEMANIVSASFISNTIMLSYVFVTGTKVPRSIFLITIFLDIFLVGGIRFAYRMFRRVVKGELIPAIAKSYKRVLIVGGGDAGSIIIREYKLRPELKVKPVAVIDDDPAKQGRSINGVPIVGRREDIVEVAKEKRVDEIIIAMPSAPKGVISDIYSECAKTNCKVKILPSITRSMKDPALVPKIRDVDIEDLLGREPIKLDIEEIASYLEGQVVLVTGGGGSIGSELCRQISQYNPRQLIILDNYENNAYEIQNELLYKHPDLNLVTVIANIREKQRLEGIFRQYRPDVVFHAAAHKHVPLMEANPTEAIKNNVFGTLNVAECADKFKAKKFVLISTDKAVNPTNIMGATKRIAEMIIQAMDRHSSTEFVAVRFGNVLGSNGSVIPLFKKQIERGGPVTVTHPEITRFFMTIPEAVQLVMQAGAMAKGGEIFVLDMGEPVKIYDLAKRLIKLSGFEPDVDIKIEFTGLRPGEKLYEELLLKEEGLRATKNNKIYVAQPIFTDLALLKREIEYLREIVMTNDDGVVEYIMTIVPTYKRTQNVNWNA